MAGNERHAVGAGELRLRKTEAAEGGEEEDDVEHLKGGMSGRAGYHGLAGRQRIDIAGGALLTEWRR